MSRVVKYVLLLGGCLTAIAVPTGIVVARHAGADAYFAAAVAALTVWVAGSLALAIAAIPCPPEQKISLVLLAMAVRMALPMVVGVALGRPGGPLADASIFGMIVVHYLIGLAIETPLLLRLLNHPDRNRADAPAVDAA